MRLFFQSFEQRAVPAAEAALLAAVLPNPKHLRANERTPYLLERQDWILAQMTRLRAGRMAHATPVAGD